MYLEFIIAKIYNKVKQKCLYIKAGTIMLYSRKYEKKLDKELFKSPTSEYRGKPFWGWNCELKPEILEEQVKYFSEMGFGGFHMHSRSGMATKYLSKDYLDLIRLCTECAKENDLFAGLYDEDRFPSGSAGGLLTKKHEYRERHLEFTKRCIESVSYEEANKTGKPYLLGAYDVILDEEGNLLEYSLISAQEKAKGNKWYAYVITADDSPIHNNQADGDTLSKEAMDEFIRLTYDFFYDGMGDEFGKNIQVMFSDEPLLRVRRMFNFAKGEEDAHVPWTMKFPEKFTEYTGLDIVKTLPELFWELPGGKVSKIRYCFYDFLAELFACSCYDNLGDWCEKHGIMLTAHLMAEKQLNYQCDWNSEAMRQYRKMQIPGIDMLCNRLELNTAKQCQSAVHQYGREGMMTELYGVTDWDFDFRGHKFQGDWQAALGATYRVPHLTWVSMEGEAKRDYPASIGYQSPWFREYKYIEDHFARVNTALTRGKPICRVAVVHPIETTWINSGPNDKTIDVRNHRDLLFSNLTEWLLFGLIDFDFICESLLPSQYEESETGFKVGKMEYDAVLVPDLQTIRSSTLNALKKFRNKGGKVVFAGQIPLLVDAENSNEARDFAQNCECILLDKISVLKALENERLIEIRDEFGSRSHNLIYNMREDGDERWLFIANAVGEGWEGKDIPKELISNNHTFCQNLKIELKGEFEPVLYDTLTGEIKEISYEIKSGKTIIPWVRYYHDSLLLNLRKPNKVSAVVNKEEFEGEEITVPYVVKFTREEANVLLFDRAEYSLNGEEFNPEEDILRLDNICREKLGLPPRQDVLVQPWAVEEEEISHSVALRMHFDSRIELENAMVGVENAENTEITFNGEKVLPNTCGYYVDHSIATIKLPKIKKGKNIIEIKTPLNKRVGIENFYLLGEFDVLMKGRKATIVAAETEIGFGDITKQGMPFYGGNITYHVPFKVENDGKINIRVNHFKGALLKLALDGKDRGIVTFDPYTIAIDGVSKGEHILDVRMFGNRHNTFGGLHNISTSNWVFSNYWRTTDHAWTYEYGNLRETGLLSAPVIKVENIVR